MNKYICAVVIEIYSLLFYIIGLQNLRLCICLAFRPKGFY